MMDIIAMEMLIAFIASFFLLGSLGLVLALNKKVFKRVDEKYFVDCLGRFVSGQITSDEWLVFLSLPIKHDPWLEELKMQVLEICETFDIRTVKAAQFPALLMEEQGVEAIKAILEKVAERPYRDF